MAKKEKPTYRCRDCAHATDFHERNWKGEYFLCKCKYQARSMFVNLEYCDNFKRKSEKKNIFKVVGEKKYGG